MTSSSAFLLFCICFSSARNTNIRSNGERKYYSGYRVLRISVPNLQRQKVTKFLEDNLIDIWKHPSTSDPNFDVMVSPATNGTVVDEVRRAGGSYSVKIEDVQKLIDEQMKAREDRPRRTKRSRRFHLNRYNTLETIYSWMYRFAARNRDLVEVLHVGTSYEGRSILALKIGTKSPGKMALWQDGLVHAREWVTGASLIWMARELVRQYRLSDTQIVDLVTKLDWYILPVFNVDGYKYTWKPGRRMWRKNRSTQHGYGCTGVDLNRNFKTPCRGIFPARRTTSDDPCSEVYHGNREFSEIEALTVSRYMEHNVPLLAATISVHSYAQHWLYPYGYTASRSPDQRSLNLLSQRIVRSIEANNGTRYRYGTISELAYPVTGGSVDWSYNYLCIKYSFGVELRDKGSYGFMLPPRLIIPTASEYFEGVKVLAEKIISDGSVQRSAHCRQTHQYSRYYRPHIRCHS